MNDLFLLPKYNWTPDLPDHRDRAFRAGLKLTGLLGPARVASLPQAGVIPFVPDSLTDRDPSRASACALAAALFSMAAATPSFRTPPDTEFLRYAASAARPVRSQWGAGFRDLLRAAQKVGAVPDGGWSDCDRVVSAALLRESARRRISSYHAVAPLYQSASEIKRLVLAGIPVLFGLSVYAGFETDAARDLGEVTYPGKTDSLLGGLPALIVGYRDDHRVHGEKFSGAVLCLHPQGDDWGAPIPEAFAHAASSNPRAAHVVGRTGRGLFWLPYRYMRNPNLTASYWAAILP